MASNGEHKGIKPYFPINDDHPKPSNKCQSPLEIRHQGCLGQSILLAEVVIILSPENNSAKVRCIFVDIHLAFIGNSLLR